MSRNPYAPPEARVLDAAEPPRVRPLAIRRAVILLCIVFPIGLLGVVLNWRQMLSTMPIGFLIGYEAVAFGVLFLLTLKIWVGRNWARITFLVLEALTAPFELMELPATAARAPLIAGFELVIIGLDLAVIYLVFFPGREWFRKVQPESGPARP